MAVTEGSLTKNLNKTGVRLWTECPFVTTLVDRSDSSWISRRTSSGQVGGGNAVEGERHDGEESESRAWK